MRLPFVQQVLPEFGWLQVPLREAFDSSRFAWGELGHLRVMETKSLFGHGLGLEPVLTTSELADYLGVHVQAIYDLRTLGRVRL